jgi:hypothetical protein
VKENANPLRALRGSKAKEVWEEETSPPMRTIRINMDNINTNKTAKEKVTKRNPKIF